MNAPEVKQRAKRIENEAIWLGEHFYSSTYNVDSEAILRRALETIEYEIKQLKREFMES